MKISDFKEEACDLMKVMVENSQKPSEGNITFVESLTEKLREYPFHLSKLKDPIFDNRQLLMVDIGDPNGKQILVACSHSDVVGVQGQMWDTNPWKLTKKNETLFGRGVCDTHGTGVSMLLAGLDEDLKLNLLRLKQKITIIFTYDEEATNPELSMRGARLAIGDLGIQGICDAKYCLVGEPTEKNDKIIPMRSHKGRFLAHFKILAPEAGHVSECKQNAFMAGASIVHKLSKYAEMMKLGSSKDKEAIIFNPPYTTLQVSAGEVKNSDYSTAPSEAKFTLDMRTLPFVHQLRGDEVTDLILQTQFPNKETIQLTIEKDAPGSTTSQDSSIVGIAEKATGMSIQGFNGGNEGRIFRNIGGKEVVTLGPGELKFAHMPNERITLDSIVHGIEIYKKIYSSILEINN